MPLSSIIVDCLVFPITTGQEEVRRDALETIEAIRRLKERHPDVLTTLGLSNVSFGLKVRPRATRPPASEIRRRAMELLDLVQLSGLEKRYPQQLSGGQRQRVAVARALALRPALVIADEPTSALDVTVQAAVLDLLARLQQEFGFGMLLVSHDLAVVRQLADDVVVLHEGRIVERGTTDRVLDDPQQDYTRMLLAAAPVADPVRQAERRRAWRAWEGAAP